MAFIYKSAKTRQRLKPRIRRLLLQIRETQEQKIRKRQYMVDERALPFRHDELFYRILKYKPSAIAVRKQQHHLKYGREQIGFIA